MGAAQYSLFPEATGPSLREIADAVRLAGGDVLQGLNGAVLRADQNIDFAQRQFDRYRGFYQGDAVTVKPHFAREGEAA